jgi:catechol 2,3-dioxygenase-like lactoylglutathione lyase family enzyme
MRLIRIDHVSLDVDDRSRSIAWYENVIGLHASGAPGAVDQPVFLGPPGARLGLFEERPASLRHIALATDAPGFDATVERLGALAIRFRVERHGASRSVYFDDPDGTTLEVTTVSGAAD